MKKANQNQHFQQRAIRLILFTFLTVSIFSCSNGDDSKLTEAETPSEAQHLSGRWKLVKKSINGQIQTANYCENLYNYYEFSADGGAIIGRYRNYSVGMTNYCEQATSESNYTVTDGILTYTSASGNVGKYNLISANDLTIKLEMFYYTSSTGGVTIPQNERVIEICNRTQ